MTINSAVLRDRYSNLTAYRSTRFFNNVYAKTKAIDTPGSGAHYIKLFDQLAFERTTPFSVRVRYKQSSPHGTAYAIVVGRANNPTNSDGWCLLIQPVTGYPYLWIAKGAEYIMVLANQNVCTGSWVDMVMVSDGSSLNTGLNLYVNGSLPTQSQDGTLTTDTLQSVSGTIFTSSSVNNVAGRVSEVAVWSRPLTSTEVSSVYNGGTSIDLRRAPGSSSLSNWWWCGDDSDTSQMIYDYVGRAHGVVTGSVTIVTDS